MYSTVVVQEVLQRSREPWRWGAQLAGRRKLTTNWEDHLSRSSYNCTRSCQELNVNHSTVVWHLKQIGKAKKLDNWVPHELTKNQKNCFEVSSSLILCNNNKTISQSDCDRQQKVDFITTGDNQLSGWTKKKLQSTSQSQICTQKRSRTLFGTLLPVWSTTAFWILEKPLHLRNMLSKLMRYTENCNACTQHGSTEWPILPHDNIQPHVTQPTLQKLNELGYEVLPHSPYSPDLSLTNHHFFKHLNNFLQEKYFHNPQEAENAFQEFSES